MIFDVLKLVQFPYDNLFEGYRLYRLKSNILINPIAEYSVSICSTPKFLCSSDDGVHRLLIRGNDTSYKSNIYKNRMMWLLYQFKIEFITITYLKVRGK